MFLLSEQIPSERLPAGNAIVFRHQSGFTNTQIPAAKNSEDFPRVNFSQRKCKFFLRVFSAVTDSMDDV